MMSSKTHPIQPQKQIHHTDRTRQRGHIERAPVAVANGSETLLRSAAVAAPFTLVEDLINQKPQRHYHGEQGLRVAVNARHGSVAASREVASSSGSGMTTEIHIAADEEGDKEFSNVDGYTQHPRKQPPPVAPPPIPPKRGPYDFVGCTGGAADGMVRGHNVTRVSHTLYKIMKLFGFSSLTDSPAGAHSEWMGELARRMAFEQPFFRYIGVDSEMDALARARKAVCGEENGDVDCELQLRDVEKEFGNATDTLFHWTELDDSPWDARSSHYEAHMIKVMGAARRAGISYIIFGQYPTLKDSTPTFRDGKWVFIDRNGAEPFILNKHVRGVVPVGSRTEQYSMYLTFYALRSIPKKVFEW